MKKVRLGKYLHYKGHYVVVMAVVRHTETLEELVYYKQLGMNEKYGLDSLWVRPKKMFLEDVVWEGKKVPRFKWLGEIQEMEE